MTSISATDDTNAKLLEAGTRLRAARRVLVLTGAGISAESGVPTFRDPEGLWRQFRPEDLATADAFARDPRLVWEWYNWRRQKIAAVRPNAAHEALARLEAAVPEMLLATQNVDGLHAQAGSARLLELHGSVWTLRCMDCRTEREDRRAPMPELPPQCECGGLLRPGVVWFGEALAQDVLYRAFAAARECEVALVVGTSSVVHPAAALPETARAHGAFVIEVNPEETPLTRLAHVSLRATAVAAVPALVGAAA